MPVSKKIRYLDKNGDEVQILFGTDSDKVSVGDSTLAEKLNDIEGDLQDLSDIIGDNYLSGSSYLFNLNQPKAFGDFGLGDTVINMKRAYFSYPLSEQEKSEKKVSINLILEHIDSSVNVHNAVLLNLWAFPSSTEYDGVVDIASHGYGCEFKGGYVVITGDAGTAGAQINYICGRIEYAG